MCRVHKNKAVDIAMRKVSGGTHSLGQLSNTVSTRLEKNKIYGVAKNFLKLSKSTPFDHLFIYYTKFVNHLQRIRTGNSF
jgi:F0F1-type ATP synthase gamma subunit